MSNPTEKTKDRRVLSVPAGITHAHMTEHNVYSCPDTFQQHDSDAEAFAPRDEEGEIPRLYCIMARVTTDPNNPAFPENLKPDYVQTINSYIGAVRHLPGILDGIGNYRFYVLCDLENGALSIPHLSTLVELHMFICL